jgi:FG-GAP-like repeat/FG-GAP repeat
MIQPRALALLAAVLILSPDPYLGPSAVRSLLALASHSAPLSSPPAPSAASPIGKPLFEQAPMYPAGESPTSVIIGDFNGDGRPDIATASSGAGTIDVLVADPKGGYGAPIQSSTAKEKPAAMVTGDFNGDGVLDLATVNPADSTVSIFLGNGDGTFQPARTFSAGNVPYSVAIADFNGDGYPDLAVLGLGSGVGFQMPGVVTLLLGRGDGTFVPQGTYAAADCATTIAVGDFNEDGAPDFVSTDYMNDTVTVVFHRRLLPSANPASPSPPR